MRLLTLKTILVATDLYDSAFPAVETGLRLATAAGASLHLLHVTRPEDDEAGATARARSRLSALCERAGIASNQATIHVCPGEPALIIDSIAAREHADVIVLGPHRESRSRTLGGTALAVVMNAACPCLVVRAPLALPLSQVVVPIDLSDTARGALLVALSWASALRSTKLSTGDRHDVTLTALHIEAPGPHDGHAPALEDEIAVTREAAGTWAGVAVRGETTTDADVPSGIVSFVVDRAPDLVVIGTRGLGLDATGRLGSVSASVLSALDTPTLLVPPSVWSAHIGVALHGAAHPDTA